ncbi:hypothetical protein AC578_3671 [Pseudocercospora eumusae]|uniref:Uncharacterized protein n=1 Tax=Pseudocercospora eumusae TaxID=321146 RepID=A0A139GXD2_9PEZI|nr:hypothetical protein AC578_3671 [Pseudocercospora eumusae]
MVIVVGTGGTAAAPVAIAMHASRIGAVTAALVSEGALAVSCAASSAVVAETGFTIAVAAESGVTALTGLTVTQFWNPVGWVVGGVLVGASQQTSGLVTWGCYKPIIGEADTKETSIKPITLAALAVHPEVLQVSVSASTGSANLPDVEVKNRAGQCYKLRGVLLPWGSAAYHAERIDESI